MSCSTGPTFDWPSGLQRERPMAPKALRPLGCEWTANLVMSPHAAGLLIGRGGKKIKLLQEDSGVRVQVHELPNGERAVELIGPPVELQDGLELLIAELARIPEALAPKAAQMLVPEEFAEDCAAEALKYGASAVVDPKLLLPGENLLMIEGSTAVRVTAASAVAACLARKLWRPGEQPQRVFQQGTKASSPGPSSESEKLPAIPWRLDAGQQHGICRFPWNVSILMGTMNMEKDGFAVIRSTVM
eukprot:s458_g5.t1